MKFINMQNKQWGQKFHQWLSLAMGVDWKRSWVWGYFLGWWQCSVSWLGWLLQGYIYVCVCVYLKTHRMVHLESLHFIVCKFYLTQVNLNLRLAPPLYYFSALISGDLCCRPQRKSWSVIIWMLFLPSHPFLVFSVEITFLLTLTLWLNTNDSSYTTLFFSMILGISSMKQGNISKSLLRLHNTKPKALHIEHIQSF